MCPFRACGFESHPGHETSLCKGPRFFLTKVACRVWVLIQMRAILDALAPFTTTSPTTWHADAQSRFHGIFEPELLENILSMGHHMLVPEGTMLMDVGQTMDAIPLLLEGAIKILRLDPNGDEIFLYFLESGDSCALSMGTYMGNAKSSIRAVTERDTSLVMVPVQIGQEWMKTYDTWSSFVLESYQSRLEEMLEAIDALAFIDLPTRLFRHLTDKVKVQGDLTLHTTHQTIANDLHTSRVVVSRLLKRFEHEGKLTLHRNAVEMKEF